MASSIEDLHESRGPVRQLIPGDGNQLHSFMPRKFLISIFLMRAMICNCGCSLVSISPIRCVSNRIRGLVFESISWRRCRGAAFLRGLRMGGDSTARSTIRAALGTRPEGLTQPGGRISRRRNPPLSYCLWLADYGALIHPTGCANE